MVTRSALQNAASIGKNILTTEAIVAEAPEKAGAAAGMRRHGRHVGDDVAPSTETTEPKLGTLEAGANAGLQRPQRNRGRSTSRAVAASGRGSRSSEGWRERA